MKIQLHHGRINLQGFGPIQSMLKLQSFDPSYNLPKMKDKIGRASCRERV